MSWLKFIRSLKRRPSRRRKSRASAYFSYLRALQIFFGAYLVCAFITTFDPSGTDYPFFSGHWFFKVPNKVYDYSLLLNELDGQALEPPRYIEKMYRRFPRVWPFAIYGSIQDWGKALQKQSANREILERAAVRMIFDDRKFKGHLVKREIDPLRFVQNGEVVQSTGIIQVQSP